ncbi:hypothetical protein DFJ74DRAFT_661678 [Hyaloraphidium curvatum]|nr:hypothetical protein DFJ74DRAFT_661678 [Hyaloraphidium curvatum]
MARDPHDPPALPDLPPELFLGIAEALAALGLRRTLLSLMLACRQSFEIGLPALGREIEIGSERGCIGWGSTAGKFLNGFARTGKYGFVRRIVVRGGGYPNGWGTFDRILNLCLPTCERLDFCSVAVRVDCALGVVNALGGRLRELSLLGRSAADTVTSVPAAIQRLVVSGSYLAVELYGTLTQLGDHLAKLPKERHLDLDLDLNRSDLPSAAHVLLPRVKICHVTDACLVGFLGVPSFAPHTIDVTFEHPPLETSLRSLAKLLGHFPSVRVLVLKGMDMRTSMLASFPPPEWVRAVVLEGPRQDLRPADFDKIRARWDGSRQLDLRMRTADWETGAAAEEREFWRSLRGKVRITLVDGFSSL